MRGARLRVQTKGELTEEVPRRRGGAQGSPQLPLHAKLVMAYTLRDEVAGWRARGFGFRARPLQQGGLFQLTGFADNLYLVATSQIQAQAMMNGVVERWASVGWQVGDAE